ncbi:methyltransferase family protein [Dyadobacter jejuensis]|uniref:Methyltransferase family protein n=1 Tax=Dyadobacter jejuensis TaxID=1082580 RepID=A0A316ANF3_9BACT|nr:methyltransferase domain-containing protein [Dyadobacter jejuensis]PWJ59076.1 methyltransferase family protein [Dyadobacter jejuensis]
MFKHRSTQKELLDAVDIPEKDLFQNLKELDFINHWLGGYAVSFNALKDLLPRDKALCVVDIGSGGGDTLLRMESWAQQQGIDLKLVGIDQKEVCIQYAESRQRSGNIQYFCDDYRNIGQYITHFDLIHASLFCHHLSHTEMVDLVRFACERKCILVINDLERNALAYWSIKVLTWLFSSSYLVKNDAPLSVLRGFKRVEWKKILQQAGAQHYRIKNKWAFRHQVIVYGKQ